MVAIYDYIEAMVRADRYLPPPPVLASQVFDVFDWPAQKSEAWTDGVADHRAGRADGVSQGGQLASPAAR